MHGGAGKAGGWSVRCEKQNAVVQKGKQKTSSVAKGLRKQNVQLVQCTVPPSDGKRIHIKVQIYRVLKSKIVQCSVHKSVQYWNAKGERQTINAHEIHSRSEWCGNLHALQGAEQGLKAGRESPPVCETGCRNPCKIDRKKLMSPLNRPKTVFSETNTRLDRG